MKPEVLLRMVRAVVDRDLSELGRRDTPRL
jgi:hypothetical protein